MAKEDTTKQNAKLSLLHADFPGILEVIRTWWFILPTVNIILLLGSLLISHLSDVPLFLAVAQPINVVLFFVLCVFLLRKTRQDWSLKKILEFNANSPTDSPVFLLVDEIVQTALKKDCYDIDQARKKPEKSILQTIVKFFDFLEFWEDC